MTDLVFVDTNVLVYDQDASEGERQERARAWLTHLWRSRGGRLSFQVLHEFYSTVTQKLKPGMDRDAARRVVRSLMAWRPLAVNATVLERAWTVQDRYGLSFWDALVVGAAQVSGCRYLLTEGLQNGQEMDGLTVLSPFEREPDAL